ncbi:MAG: hypothetical protein WDZ59_14325 [Pirellulales bacterium]
MMKQLRLLSGTLALILISGCGTQHNNPDEHKAEAPSNRIEHGSRTNGLPESALRPFLNSHEELDQRIDQAVEELTAPSMKYLTGPVRESADAVLQNARKMKAVLPTILHASHQLTSTNFTNEEVERFGRLFEEFKMLQSQQKRVVSEFVTHFAPYEEAIYPVVALKTLDFIHEQPAVLQSEQAEVEAWVMKHYQELCPDCAHYDMDRATERFETANDRRVAQLAAIREHAAKLVAGEKSSLVSLKVELEKYTYCVDAWDGAARRLLPNSSICSNGCNTVVRLCNIDFPLRHRSQTKVRTWIEALDRIH